MSYLASLVRVDTDNVVLTITDDGPFAHSGQCREYVVSLIPYEGQYCQCGLSGQCKHLWCLSSLSQASLATSRGESARIQRELVDYRSR